MITSKQLKMLEYHEKGLANMKTDNQRLAIELSDREKSQKKREQLLNKVKPAKQLIWLNHLSNRSSMNKYINYEDLTPELIEKEIDYFNNI